MSNLVSRRGKKNDELAKTKIKFKTQNEIPKSAGKRSSGVVFPKALENENC